MLRTLDSSLDYIRLAREFRSCMMGCNQFWGDFYKVIDKAKGRKTTRNLTGT
jgi:hypothetical protein